MLSPEVESRYSRDEEPHRLLAANDLGKIL